MISTLTIENIECYSWHGCLQEESTIGGRFSVDVIIEADFRSAIATDQLIHAANYVDIHNLVRAEMDIPSKLIEHVAGRILINLEKKYSDAVNIIVTVKKYNPPVNGFIGTASIRLSSQ
ncbi:MAG: dihydroneopterin aldolase [Bacteroidota bacterium]